MMNSQEALSHDKGIFIYSASGIQFKHSQYSGLSARGRRVLARQRILADKTSSVELYMPLHNTNKAQVECEVARQVGKIYFYFLVVFIT